jgi:6-pyruvoyltetrahydropterin/6-carboxytetrahydropterin synthase
MMRTRIYKEVFFDATHRLLHYPGKCKNLHGHRWKVEVWIEGEVEETSCILVDYNVIKAVIERFDHAVILNEADPMVAALREFQPVCTTPGDPSSELLAETMQSLIEEECRKDGRDVRVARIRVWESATCYAELCDEDR